FTYLKGEIQMASAKQLYYTESLVGKAIINNKVSNKEEVWDKLELLPETKLEDLDNKQMSEVIKKLNQINE
ncbi:hypothetical protein QCE86_13845, partial [Staphylococcus aureus]|nr:hypothetical protein [Staphylococcus aureus]